jgi:hypothetical protein
MAEDGGRVDATPEANHQRAGWEIRVGAPRVPSPGFGAK